uniref:XrtA/PEP-CTERM system histidine kinase PrsK n=1 Tax=Thaumasiovibrio occultus TaxID=1891184 RepID=UPI000B34DC83|nr:XrtA/PEP-CTERM system histidine kinase PrsK [Thaumasiovibrio occultus]
MNQLGMAFYSLSAIGFLFLLVLLITRRDRKPFIRLVSAAAFSGVFLSVSALNGELLPLTLLLETLFNASLCAAIYALLSASGSVSRIKYPYLAFFLAAVLLEAINFSLPIALGLWVIGAHLLESLAGLYLLELLYRVTPSPKRWMIKPLALGFGAIFVTHFVLYADALLFGGLDQTLWQVRGIILLIAIPFIILGIRRLKQQGSRLFVSRTVVYGSTIILFAGVYLLMMALLGYYIRATGHTWSQLAQVAFYALSITALVAIQMMEKWRSRLKIFISKHFFANRYEYREEWLTLSSSLAALEGSPYSAAIKAMMRPFQCRGGALLTASNNSFTITHTENLPKDSLDELAWIQQHLAGECVTHDWIYDQRQATRHAMPKSMPFQVTKPNNLTNHLPIVIPLTSAHHFRGAIVLSVPPFNKVLDWEDRDLIKAIASQLAMYCHLYQASEKLAEHQQFAAFNRMSAFLVHDLKNVSAQLRLISKNAALHKDNPEFIADVFDTVIAAGDKVDNIVKQVTSKRLMPKANSRFNLRSALVAAAQRYHARSPKPQLVIPDSLHQLEIDVDRDRFENVIGHLIQNAQEATPADGSLHISLYAEDNLVTIDIADTGAGMTEDFIRDRLFHPFDTTKGNQGLGLGAYDAKTFVEENHGHLYVQSSLGIGTTFSLVFQQAS